MGETLVSDQGFLEPVVQGISLQQRNKWEKTLSNLQPEDVILVKEDNLPLLQWFIERVIQLHIGKDILVRIATVKMLRNIIICLVTKLSRIHIKDSVEGVPLSRKACLILNLNLRWFD